MRRRLYSALNNNAHRLSSGIIREGMSNRLSSDVKCFLLKFIQSFRQNDEVRFLRCNADLQSDSKLKLDDLQYIIKLLDQKCTELEKKLPNLISESCPLKDAPIKGVNNGIIESIKQLKLEEKIRAKETISEIIKRYNGLSPDQYYTGIKRWEQRKNISQNFYITETKGNNTMYYIGKCKNIIDLENGMIVAIPFRELEDKENFRKALTALDIRYQ